MRSSSLHACPRCPRGRPAIGALPPCPARRGARRESDPLQTLGLRSGEPSDSELDRGQDNEGGQGLGEVLEVLGETPVSSEPGKGTLNHPPARQHDKTLHVVAPLDDLHAQHRPLCHCSFNLPGVVAAIGPDQFEPREAAAYLVEDQPGPVAVLDRGGVDNDPHRQPFAIDQGVDLAPLDLLTSVVTHLVVPTAPFSADLTDWLSRTAAEGLARRPIRSRNAMCSWAQIASQTPSRWNLRRML